MGSPAELSSNVFAYKQGDVRDLATMARSNGGWLRCNHLSGGSYEGAGIDPRSGKRLRDQCASCVERGGRRPLAHVILASTGGALFGTETAPIREGMVLQPQSPYGASKLAMEGYAPAFAGSYGCRTTALRLPMSTDLNRGVKAARSPNSSVRSSLFSRSRSTAMAAGSLTLDRSMTYAPEFSGR